MEDSEGAAGEVELQEGDGEGGGGRGGGGEVQDAEPPFPSPPEGDAASAAKRSRAQRKLTRRGGKEEEACEALQSLARSLEWSPAAANG